MTTAHKPTYHPAIGTGNQGGYRYHAPRQQFSVKDVASHTKLKFRQVGQDAPGEIEVRDLKAELEQREKQHFDKVTLERQRAGLIPYATKPVAANPNKQMAKIDWSKYDDSDFEDEDESDSEDSEDSEDETALLMQELERIKKDRQLEAKKQKAKELQEEKKKESELNKRGNPLLTPEGTTFNLKRRWDHDVVFKNQSRDEPKQLKRFINDVIRSDFHRNFMRRYIK